MDLKATLFLTPRGMQESGNKRSALDFKARSILTSLKNKEKTLSELLDKIFIENKEAVTLVQALFKDGFVTTELSASAKVLGAAIASGESANLSPSKKPSAVTIPAASTDKKSDSVKPLQSPATSDDESRTRQNELIARVRMERARAEQEELARKAEADRVAMAEAQRKAAENEAKRAAEDARRIADALRIREVELAAAEEARLAAEMELHQIQQREHARLEAERKEAERKEAERKEAERKEAERNEAEREEAERKEAERKEAERKEAERKEVERKEAERKEAERKEAERKEAERKEAERKEAERKEAERKEAERKEAERKEAERKEAGIRTADGVLSLKRNDDLHALEHSKDNLPDANLPAPTALSAADLSIQEEAERERRRTDGARIAAEIQANLDRESQQKQELERIESEKALRRQEIVEYEQRKRDEALAKTHVSTSPTLTIGDSTTNDSALADVEVVADIGSESLVPALTDEDSIDIIQPEEARSPEPAIGKSLRPVLARFLPSIRRKTSDSSEMDAVTSSKSIPQTETATAAIETEGDVVGATGSIRPKIDLKPVVSKVRKENASRHIPSLIKPAIDTSKKESTGGLLGNPGPGGAGGDFLSSFGRESASSVPGTKSGGIRLGRGKPDLTPISASATKATTLLPKIVVSEGIFLLSDFCIDHMSSSAADLINQIERCRDRISLQAVIKDIGTRLSPSDKSKLAALIKTVDEINATA